MIVTNPVKPKHGVIAGVQLTAIDDLFSTLQHTMCNAYIEAYDHAAGVEPCVNRLTGDPYILASCRIDVKLTCSNGLQDDPHPKEDIASMKEAVVELFATASALCEQMTCRACLSLWQAIRSQRSEAVV